MTIKAYLIQTGILALVFFAVFYSIRLYTFNEVSKQYNRTIERLELEQQLDIMKAYMAVLEERAKIEGIHVR